MTTFDTRMSILATVHMALHKLVDNPPKLRGNDYVTDVGQVETKLDEIDVYWNAYRQVAKIEADRYAIRNMMQAEREQYLDCVWWFNLLRSVTKVVKSESFDKP